MNFHSHPFDSRYDSELIYNLVRRKIDAEAKWIALACAFNLPPAITREVNLRGINCSQFVKNWMNRHVLLRRHPDKMELVYDGRVVANRIISVNV